MLRTPEPKEQARLLVQLLSQAGLQLGHQASLNVVAQLHGHRNWNVMEASAAKTSQAATPATDSPEAPTPRGWEEVIAAVEDVVSNADDTGCDGDLTVTSLSAVDRLNRLMENYRRDGAFVYKSQHGFSAADVLSVRPDLTDEQAEEVVRIADEEFDSNVGVNWDVLEDHASKFPHQVVPARLMNQDTDEEVADVVVDYADGSIYWGSFADLDKMSWSERQLQLLLFKKLDYTAALVVQLSDDTFVDLDKSNGGALFGGDTTALRNSLQELREDEEWALNTLIYEFDE